MIKIIKATSWYENIKLILELLVYYFLKRFIIIKIKIILLLN